MIEGVIRGPKSTQKETRIFLRSKRYKTCSVFSEEERNSSVFFCQIPQKILLEKRNIPFLPSSLFEGRIEERKISPPSLSILLLAGERGGGGKVDKSSQSSSVTHKRSRKKKKEDWIPVPYTHTFFGGCCNSTLFIKKLPRPSFTRILFMNDQMTTLKKFGPC